MENLFHWFDWVIVGATMLLSLGIGAFYAKKNDSKDEMLMGGRKLQIIPVAASIMATYVSAVTVLGFPAEIYSFGSQIIIYHVVGSVAVCISAFLLIPFFYNMKLTSINEYLELRFKSIWVRWLTAGVFIVQQTLLSSVVLFAPSIVIKAFLGFNTWISILGVGLCGTIYTSIGGLKAVVWTDLFQSIMMIVGMICIAINGFTSVGGIGPAFKIASEGGRLDFIDTTFDPFVRHNLWNFIFGGFFFALMQPAVHQLQVQRYCSMPSLTNAKKVIVYSIPFKFMLIGLCFLTGISIFALYEGCDPYKRKEIKKVDQIVTYFVVHEMTNVPGMIGLFTACIFSAVLSSISSSLNSLAAVTFEDFLSRFKFMSKISNEQQAHVTRFLVFTYGVLIIGCAFMAQNLGAIYTAAFGAMAATAGVIYGIFILAMAFPSANYKGGIAGICTSSTIMMFISVLAFMSKNKNLVRLPTSIDKCPISLLSNMTTETIIATEIASEQEQWWEIIGQLSYQLYSIVGALITLVVGIIVSQLTGGSKVSPERKYIHPCARKWMKKSSNKIVKLETAISSF